MEMSQIIKQKIQESPMGTSRRNTFRYLLGEFTVKGDKFLDLFFVETRKLKRRFQDSPFQLSKISEENSCALELI